MCLSLEFYFFFFSVLGYSKLMKVLFKRDYFFRNTNLIKVIFKISQK